MRFPCSVAIVDKDAEQMGTDAFVKGSYSLRDGKGEANSPLFALHEMRFASKTGNQWQQRAALGFC